MSNFATKETENRLALMCHYGFWQKTEPDADFTSLAQSIKHE
jgi:hypothetical protein